MGYVEVYKVRDKSILLTTEIYLPICCSAG